MSYNIIQGQSLFKHSVDEIPDLNDPDYKPHTHSTNYELFYFISGDAYFNVDGYHYEMRNGTLLLIKPGTQHNIVFKSNKKYERIVIRFKESDLTAKLAEKIKETDNIYFVRNSELSKEIMRLDDHFSNLDNDWILFTFNNSLQIILSYVVNYRESELNNNQSDEVLKIVNYLNNNLLEIADLKDICQDLNISKSALCKKFTDAVGVPIMTYVRLKKLLLARDLMENGQSPTTVYKQCGFNDYTAFYRAYKKTFQESPKKTKINNH